MIEILEKKKYFVSNDFLFLTEHDRYFDTKWHASVHVSLCVEIKKKLSDIGTPVCHCFDTSTVSMSELNNLYKQNISFF